MRLKLSKCHFAAAELPFLNRIVGRFGLKMDPAKVNKLKLTKLPANKKHVRQFLGLAEYFRDFIKNIAETAALLSNLTRDAQSDNFELPSTEKEAAITLKQKVCKHILFSNFQTSIFLST